ncbi:hypothetical protein GOBAR_DD05199 [Gossypium barbadense]|nr:hypothetical protein GOBAR_DD05199 [Gossypium barbadense]
MALYSRIIQKSNYPLCAAQQSGRSKALLPSPASNCDRANKGTQLAWRRRRTCAGEQRRAWAIVAATEVC